MKIERGCEPCKYLKATEDGWDFVEQQDDATHVILEIKDFYGYVNALRVLRDRGRSQIDKSQADDHGYRLLRAESRKIDRNNSEYMWQITKSTPYSIHIDVKRATELIVRDLRSYYNFFTEADIEEHLIEEDYYNLTGLKSAYDFWKKNGNDKTFQSGHKRYTWMLDMTNGCIACDMKRLSVNNAAGVYEVTYWATEPV